MNRQVRTFNGILFLQWSNNSHFLKLFFGNSFVHNISLKNLIKFRGYLREYCCDVKQMDRKSIDFLYNGTKIIVIPHINDLYSTIKFIGPIARDGYYNLEAIERTSSCIGRSINLLFEEHYLQQCETAWKSKRYCK